MGQFMSFQGFVSTDPSNDIDDLSMGQILFVFSFKQYR
jgi:hypothetical protein